MTAETRSDNADALSVFISYSRSEVRFADELELFLSNSGYRPLIDRNAIDAGEAWKDRLGDLILAADSVVFVLSDTSAASATCRWEAEQAELLSKRILVVTQGPVSSSIELPQQLAGINWISCWTNPAVPASSQTRGFFDLSAALRTDLGWRRQQTVLQEQARRWTDRAAIANSPLLLRQDLLAEALDWARRIPKGASVPREVAAFLGASEAHEAQLAAEASAGLAEREAALKAAEQAAVKQSRAERGLRIVSVVALCIGTSLFAGATAAAWFAAEYFVRSREVQSAVIADAAFTYVKEHDDLKALRVALMADPSANASIVESLLRPDGYHDARAALERAWLSRSFSDAIKIPEPEFGAATEIQLRRMPEPVRVLSRDGSRLFTGYSDGRIEVLETGSGKTWKPDQRSEAAIRSAAFADGSERLITTSEDGHIVLRSLEGKPLTEARLGKSADFVAIASDASIAALIDEDGGVHVWNTETGRLVQYPLPKENEPGYSYTGTCAVAVSPDRNWVAAARRNGSVIVWPTGFPEVRRFLSASASDPAITLAGYNNVSRSFSERAALSQMRSELLAISNDNVRAPLKICPLSISAGNSLVAAATDQNVSVWKLPPAEPRPARGDGAVTGELAQRFMSFPSNLMSIRLTSEEGGLKIVYADGRVDEIDRDTEFQVPGSAFPGRNLLPAPRPRPFILAETPVDGGHLFLTGLSPSLDLVTRRIEPVFILTSEFASECRSIAGIELAPDDPEPTAICTELISKESEPATGSAANAITSRGKAEASGHFLHDPDFLSGPGQILVDVWPEEEPTEVAWESPFGPVAFSFGTILVRSQGTELLSYSPDRRRAVTVGIDGTTRFWSAGSDQPLELEQPAAPSPPEDYSFETMGFLGLPIPAEVSAIAFDQRSDHVLIGYSDGTLETRSFATGAIIEVHPVENCRISSILADSRERMRYIGCQSGDIQIWHQGASQPSFAANFGSEIMSLAQSPDYRHLFAGLANGSVAILSAVNLWELGRSPVVAQAFPSTLTIMTDRQQIAAGYSNGMVRTWKVPEFLGLSIDQQIEKTCMLLSQSRGAELEAADFTRFTSLRAISDPCTD